MCPLGSIDVDFAALSVSVSESVSPKDLVEWAIREGRVLIIFDGFDQVVSEKIMSDVAQYLNLDGKNCHAIVTGRPNKVNLQRDVFSGPVNGDSHGLRALTTSKSPTICRGTRLTNFPPSVKLSPSC